MAESTLSKVYADFREAIGYELGYGRTSGSWTSVQQADIDACFKDGQRRFYAAHNWSFLELVAELTTAADTAVYDLPDDFASIVGDITWPESGGGYFSIPVTGEGQIRAMQQGRNLAAGRPLFAAVRVNSDFDGTAGQRFELVFERAFDGEYVLNYRYRVLPSAVASTKYPFGGMQHADTLEACCLAVAEQKMKGQRGVHWDEYQRLLAISIQRDNDLRPKVLGYNGDNSGGQPSNPRFSQAQVFYNSQQST